MPLTESDLAALMAVRDELLTLSEDGNREVIGLDPTTFDALLADLRTARQERDQAREALQQAEHVICGVTYQNPDWDERLEAQRSEESKALGLGCQKRFKIMYAYRCVDCGRWFCKECIVHHFAVNGDPMARALQASDEAYVSLLTSRDAKENALRETIRHLSYTYWPAADVWRCVSCHALEGESHTRDCEVAKALAATTKEEKADG